MELEYKAAPTFTKAIDDRTVVGIAAVHGNVDGGGDRSWPGSFETSVNGRNRVRFLWQHNSMEPPIAAINYIREIPRAELPQTVLDYAPDATGGVEVSRTYLTDAFADRVFQGIKAGAVAEMSYAYEPVKWDYEEIEGREFPVRNLRQMKIYDLSDVVWGMNPATSADGSKGSPLFVEQAAVRAAVVKLADRWEGLHSLRAKEGRRFSSASVQEIEEAIAALEAATTRLKGLIAAPEPEKVSRDAWQQAQAAYREQRQRLAALGVEV